MEDFERQNNELASMIVGEVKSEDDSETDSEIEEYENEEDSEHEICDVDFTPIDDLGSSAVKRRIHGLRGRLVTSQNAISQGFMIPEV